MAVQLTQSVTAVINALKEKKGVVRCYAPVDKKYLFKPQEMVDETFLNFVVTEDNRGNQHVAAMSLPITLYRCDRYLALSIALVDGILKQGSRGCLIYCNPASSIEEIITRSNEMDYDGDRIVHSFKIE